jgi:hypothetical protein
MVQMYESGRSPHTQIVTFDGNLPNDEELIKKYDKDIYKMSRAEFLMSQIDLDPIQSNYS